MVLVISRFRVANGLDDEVRAAFVSRPRLVEHAPGFLGMDTFTGRQDPSCFYLMTRWTDEQSFQRWHTSPEHHQSHLGIPKGLKLDSAWTQVLTLDRIDADKAPALVEEMVADASPLLVRYLLASQGSCWLRAAEDGTIRWCNPAMAALLHEPAGGLIGQPVWNRLTAPDAERLRGFVDGRLEARDEDLLLNFVASDQSVQTLACHLSVRPDGFTLVGEIPNRQSEALQSQLMELTDQLAVLHRESVRKSKALERINIERENALKELRATNQQLAASRAAAENAMRAKSDLLATMSHEIRTPISGILGIGKLLLETPLTPEQTEFAQIIYDSSDALLRMINDVLDLSALEAGKLDLNPGLVDIRGMVAKVVALLGPLAREKHVAIDFRPAAGVPSQAEGDEGRLRQVLLNLAGNALKFTPAHGQIEITVAVENAELKPTLRFAVRDTGAGISEDAQRRLFQPFTQADASIAGEYGGSGLGLSISRRLVEKMGGEIGVQSSPGEGSTFWFRIPLISTDPMAPAPAAVSVLQKGTRALTGLQVLVVDDNWVNQKVAASMIQKLGGRCDIAANGLEALAALAFKRYDVVLMDCQMPGMDGYHTTAEIRRAEQGWARVPIVALTASTALEDRQRCLAAGMDDYLTKPLELDRLGATLVRLTTANTCEEQPLGDGHETH